VYVSLFIDRAVCIQNADIQLLSLIGRSALEEYPTSEGVGDFSKGVYQVEYGAGDCYCLGWMSGRRRGGLRHV